ncbi:hypothetical protein EIP86_004876 [Pleurotus ostreatoroseus]|nr:hypothetical protein EIP86_004876 [Pleurotus ostreatoroseus]
MRGSACDGGHTPVTLGHRPLCQVLSRLVGGMFSLRAVVVRSAGHRLLAVSSRALASGYGLRKPATDGDAQTKPAEGSLLGRITELTRSDPRNAKATDAPQLTFPNSRHDLRHSPPDADDLKYKATSAALDLRNLPYNTTPDDLHKHFAPYGTLKIVRLILDGEGRCRGGAYIAFESIAQAQASLDAHLKPKGVLPQLHDRPLFIRPAGRDPAKKARLYAKHLPTHVSPFEVKAFFVECGCAPTAVRIATRPGRGAAIAFAHLDFSSKEEAEVAQRVMDGVTFPGQKHGRPMRVSLPKHGARQEHGRTPTDTLFVGNIGPLNSSTGRAIDEFFEEFEPIQVRLREQKGMREMDVVPMPWDRDGKGRKTYALVQFRTVDDAERAIDACKERMLPNGQKYDIQFTTPMDGPDAEERHFELWA